MRRPQRFDKTYYERHYRDPRTRVGSARATALLADHVAAALKHHGVAVRRILDAGCGLGFWRDPLARAFPRARYVGLEYSEHLCAELGWIHGSIADPDLKSLIGAEPFDLVVCQGVLQYLDDRAAAGALANLAKSCRGALYLEALTQLDWRENADQGRTDGAVHLRSGTWYRRRLVREFASIGSGIFVKRDAHVVLWELERGDL